VLDKQKQQDKTSRNATSATNTRSTIKTHQHGLFFNLPKAIEGYNRVLLVVDQELKIVKLIPYNKEATAEKTAILYMKYVYCNYRLPVLIVSDQDTQFDSKFWKALWKLIGMTLHMEVVRHPETDSQAEHTI
jgi:hypothetical protein